MFLSEADTVEESSDNDPEAENDASDPNDVDKAFDADDAKDSGEDEEDEDEPGGAVVMPEDYETWSLDKLKELMEEAGQDADKMERTQMVRSLRERDAAECMTLSL